MRKGRETEKSGEKERDREKVDIEERKGCEREREGR